MFVDQKFAPDWKYWVCWRESSLPAHNGYFVSFTRASQWMQENREYLIAEWERSLENILLAP